MENPQNLVPLQSAYRALHSTETAGTRVVKDLLSATASKSLSVMLSLDISAAFDNLDHPRLLVRGKNLFGFDSADLQWLELYIVWREQFVGVASCHSWAVKLVSGVPQGSVIRPLLFSIFTKPVGNLISSFEIRYHQFTNETQLHAVINTTSPTGLATLSACANAVTRRYTRNDLLLNPTKREDIVIGTRQQIVKWRESRSAVRRFRSARHFGSLE